MGVGADDIFVGTCGVGFLPLVREATAGCEHGEGGGSACESGCWSGLGGDGRGSGNTEVGRAAGDGPEGIADNDVVTAAISATDIINLVGVVCGPGDSGIILVPLVGEASAIAGDGKDEAVIGADDPVSGLGGNTRGPEGADGREGVIAATLPITESAVFHVTHAPEGAVLGHEEGVLVAARGGGDA